MDESYRSENFEVESFKQHRFNANQIIFNQIRILVNEMTNKKIMRICKNDLLNVKRNLF